MSSPLPPDPYQALGVAKDATATQIKTVYRKLVLKCHPDKIQDPSKKQAAVDEFHRIQTAYEIIGDDERRHRYDAAMKLAELRRAAMEERMRRPAARDDAHGRSYTTTETMPRGYPPRDRVYEERRPDNAYDRRPSDPYGSDYPYDQPPRATARKEDDRYEKSASAKRSPPKSERDRAKEKARSSKEASARAKDKGRKSEREIKREREEIKRDRERKYAPSVQSSPSESGSESPYERQRSQMREEEEIRRRMREEEEVRRKLREEEDEQRRARDRYRDQVRRQQEQATRRSADDPAARAEKLFQREAQAQADAREYMQRSHGYQTQEDRDSSPARSTKDKAEVIRDRYGRPIQVRRGTGKTKPAEKSKSSKTKTTEKSRSSREKETPRGKVQDIVDEEIPRRPATLNQSYSSPESIRIPDYMPATEEKQRSSSMDQRPDPQAARPPQMRRAETMPIPRTSASSPQKKTTTAPARGSNLRTTQTSANQPTQSVPTYEVRPEPSPQSSPNPAAPRKTSAPTAAAMPKTTTTTTTTTTRKTEMHHGQPTPQPSPGYESAPETEIPSARPAYARDSTDDDEDQFTSNNRPADFRTEVRVPANSQPRSRENERYTRSPSPGAEPYREKQRPASSKYAERPKAVPVQRGERGDNRSASYVYKTTGYDSDSRPKPSRGESNRTTKGDKSLYGEIPRSTASPTIKQSRYAAEGQVRYARDVRPEDVRPQTGYNYSTSSRRPSAAARPSYTSRHASYNHRPTAYA